MLPKCRPNVVRIYRPIVPVCKPNLLRYSRAYSTILRTPPPSAPRESPTPLVFVSAKSWDPDSYAGIKTLTSFLSEKGYTCLQADLSLPEVPNTDSTQIMDHFEAELRGAILLSAIPFPPVVFAKSSACLIAQTYISSYPACGLVLISPPVSNNSVPETQLPNKLPEFDFEPKFPVAIMASSEEMKALRQSNRLARDPGVDTITLAGVQGEGACAEIERWLDELGI